MPEPLPSANKVVLLPEPTVIDAPFWDGLRAGELRLQHCTGCQSFQYPAETFCYDCGSADLEWEAASGGGTVYSFITVHQRYHAAFAENLPYNVSVPVLIHLLTLLPSLERGLVMVQAEVADRLAAPPGSKTYGVPSVKAAWFADVRRAGSIGRNVFWPAPNVDSGLVAWTRREPPETTATREQVFAVVDAAFAQRRKMLRSSLRQITPDSEALLQELGIDPKARAQELEIADFCRIANALHR